MEHQLLPSCIGSTEAVVQQLEIGEKARFTISRKAMMMMMMMILGPKKQLYDSVGNGNLFIWYHMEPCYLPKSTFCSGLGQGPNDDVDDVFLGGLPGLSP